MLLEIIKLFYKAIFLPYGELIQLLLTIILALGAILAATYAKKTYEISRLERRAIIAPIGTGFCGLQEDKSSFLEFDLKNFGINTAEMIHGDVFCLVNINKDKEKNSYTGSSIGTFDFNNIKPWPAPQKLYQVLS